MAIVAMYHGPQGSRFCFQLIISGSGSGSANYFMTNNHTNLSFSFLLVPLAQKDCYNNYGRFLMTHIIIWDGRFLIGGS